MRTTLDLPDALFRRLKARAALAGIPLKALLERYLAAGLQTEEGVAEPGTATRSSLPSPSAYDLMKDGVGIVDSGYSDLATNPEHLDGLGSD